MKNPSFALAVAAGILASSALPAQTEERAGSVELTVGIEDSRGRAPLELSPGDLQVRRDGVATPVLALDPLAGDGLRAWRRGRETPPLAVPWRIVVYLDPALQHSGSLPRLAKELAARAGTLTALGSVQVVVADSEPTTRLGATRDPKLVAAVLEEIGREPPRRGEIEWTRRHDLRVLRSNPGADADAGLRFVRSAAEEEREVVVSRLGRLLAWLATEPGDLPKALLWGTDGFDLEPGPFYARASPRGSHRVEAELAGVGCRDVVLQTADALARGGWVAVPLATGAGTDGDLFLAPEDPLRIVAETTGGTVASGGDLDGALRQLGTSWRLVLPPAAGATDEGRLDVRLPGSRWRLRAPRLAPFAGGRIDPYRPPPPRTDARAVDLRDAGVPDPAAVYLLPPDEELATGPTVFRAQATRRDVAAVVFRLDGQELGTDREAPFEVSVDLPAVPRTATVRAVALDSSGAELGSDELEINPLRGALSVAFHAPAPVLRPGVATVKLDVEAPVGAGFPVVDLFWNEERVAHLAHPPYEYELTVPPDVSHGFLRATATLPDGETAEAALATGPDGFAGQVDVDLVELPVTVKDSRGRPVAGLRREDLTIREDGIEQSIRDLRSAGETPLTVALALDVSTSLAAQMPLLKEAATGFLSRVLRPRDRGLLVAFADRPHLVQPLTRDHRRLGASIAALPILPNTALADAVMVSIYHLRGASGRKAVVLLTDGSDNQSRHSFHQAYELARRAGLPVYVIGVARSDRGLRMPHRLEMQRLATATGASFHFVHQPGQLEAAYQEIDQELRSQYLVSYESTRSDGPDGWREVSVETTRRGLTARTVAGYFAD